MVWINGIGQKETALLWRSRAVSEGKDKKDRKDHEP